MWWSIPSFTPFMLALRNILSRKLRTLLTCLGIVLGVAVVLGITMTNESTLASFRQVFDETSGKAQIVIKAKDNNHQPLKPNVLNRVKNETHILAAAPAISITTFREGDNQNWSPSVSMSGRGKGNVLLVMGVDPDVDLLVRSYDLKEGRWIQGERHEAVISAQYADEKGLNVGDKLVVLTPDGQAHLKVIGILKNTGAAMTNGGNVAFIPISAAQEIFARGDRYDNIDLVIEPRFAENPEKLAELKSKLQAAVGEDYDLEYPGSRGQTISQMLQIYQQGLLFFSVMALFIGSFLIYNTFSMTVLERTSEIGMLRAVGMSRKQIMEMVLAEAVLLGLTGSILGVIFGVFLGRGLLYLMGGLFTVKLTSTAIPISGLVQSLLVGIGVTIFSALLPAYQASKISPLAALKAMPQTTNRIHPKLWMAGLALCILSWVMLEQFPPTDNGLMSVDTLAIMLLLLGATMIIPNLVTLLERFIRPLSIALYKQAGDLGSRNIQRSILRTTLSIAALMIGITLIIGIGAVTTSFENDLNNWVNTAIGGDLQVGSPNPMREQFGNQLADVPGVEAVTMRTQFDVKPTPEASTRSDETLIFNAIDPETFILVNSFQFTQTLYDTQTTWDKLNAGQGLFVSTSVADHYNLVPGGILMLQTQRGDQPFVVLAVVVDFNPQGKSIFGTRQDAGLLFGQTKVDRFTLSVSPGYDVNQVKADIEGLYKKRKNIIVATSAEYKNCLSELTQQAFTLLNILSMIGVIISALGVINTLMMSVMERQREIGGLRSLGMLQRQVWQMIQAEAASLGLMGGLFGIGFGAAVANLLIKALNAMGNYTLDFIIPLDVFAWGAFLSLVVSQLAALYPAWQAAKVNIIQSIKHE